MLKWLLDGVLHLLEFDQMQLVRFKLSLSCTELLQRLQADVGGFVKTIVYAKLDLCGLGY